MRVGVRVMVGVFDAVGLGINVLVGAGLGMRFKAEQACIRSAGIRSISSLRIGVSHESSNLIIPFALLAHSYDTC